MREKAYENNLGNPFENETELKKRIASVWKDTAFNLPKIRRAIERSTGRLKTVTEREGQRIKMIYG